MTEEKKPTAPCPACGTVREAFYVGTASGRPHFECSCGAKWVGKNPAAAALGRLGGQARFNGMTQKEKTTNATNAANTRWRKRLLDQNVTPAKVRKGIA